MPSPRGFIILQTAGEIGSLIDQGDIISPVKAVPLTDGQVMTWNEGQQAFVGSSGGAATLPYTQYTALISQAGGAAPSATTVLQDTITGITFSRFTTGQYLVTKSGAWLANKIFLQITINRTPAEFAAGVYFSFNRSTNNDLLINTYIGNGSGGLTATDGLLSNTPIEIRLYP